ncbi:unnamed protein product [Fraxinus pennsylvanica]|uniref:26S proteasome regulatory subunit 7-like OB domain-containing protein n=1 Tax=Fraxinus pennsylvanica TaxID=56036 RepID=A0AAD1Z913_9LAMI|nr:unnamed protein product [Fraxinus pennsylvanica]
MSIALNWIKICIRTQVSRSYRQPPFFWEGFGPYSTSIKKVEKEIAKKINDLCGIEESDTGLTASSQWDLVSDKQMMQEEQPLQVARCTKIISLNIEDAKYVINVKQIAKESSIERDDIKEPFTEVSMFKKNYDHLTKDTYFGMYKEATRGNPNYFLTYGNGKSAARVQDHLRPNGAHRWHNYMKTPNEIKLEEAAVLHYTYSKFSDLTSRRDRCGCKPTKEDVKRCFMLEFDRSAFIIASTATEEEMLNWYREHVVWTDRTLNLKLLRKGILTRIYAPMTIIQGLRESGVFGAVIASAQGSLSKDMFLASVDSSNSSRTTSGSESFSSRKIGRSIEYQAIARRTLKIIPFAPHEPAFPPLSPPIMDDDHLIIEA